MTNPNSCRWCGIDEREHARRWSPEVEDSPSDLAEPRLLPDLPGYSIYSDGQIEGPSGSPLSFGTSEGGYLTFSGPRRRPSNQKCYRVHVVVCRAFHGEKPYPKAQVRHLDGDKANNAAANLQWGTSSQNAADRNLHGNTRYGLDNIAGKLSDDQVSAVKDRYATGRYTQLEVARAFGVSRSLVGQIVRGEVRKPRVVGWHTWEQPTQEQIKQRMRARRASR